MSPTAEHERRREALATMAVLAGCEMLLEGLPDGSLPDVLRWRACDGLLFIGEAKDTESPNCQATQLRLHGYACWLRSQSRPGVLAVVHCAKHNVGWLRLVTEEAGQAGSAVRQLHLSASEALTWVLFEGRDEEFATRSSTSVMPSE